MPWKDQGRKWHTRSAGYIYTALYHTMLQPNIYNDVDGQYRGRDLEVHKAEGFNYYTSFHFGIPIVLPIRFIPLLNQSG